MLHRTALRLHRTHEHDFPAHIQLPPEGNCGETSWAASAPIIIVGTAPAKQESLCLPDPPAAKYPSYPNYWPVHRACITCSNILAPPRLTNTVVCARKCYLPVPGRDVHRTYAVLVAPYHTKPSAIRAMAGATHRGARASACNSPNEARAACQTQYQFRRVRR